MAQWLDHGALQSSSPAVQIQTLLEAYFQRNIIFHPFKRWNFFRCLCTWTRQFTLKYFTFSSFIVKYNFYLYAQFVCS